MSIGTAERPINIKDLILDTPERTRELPFDPEREITQEMWEKMKRKFERIRGESIKGRGFIPTFLQGAATLSLLFPDRRDELHLELGDEEEQGIRKEIETLRSESEERGSQAGEFVTFAGLVYLFDPKRRKDLFPTQAEEERIWQLRRDSLLALQRQERWNSFLLQAERALFLFPHHRGEILGDEKKAWKGIQSVLSDRYSKGEFHIFAQDAARAVLLFPERHEEFQSDERIWGKARHCFFSDSPNHLTALAMKILAADEAKINDQGLIEITMRKPKKDFAPSTPPMPEVRRF